MTSTSRSHFDRAANLALSLLDHDGLMTPRLNRMFGPISARQLTGESRGATFQRVSEVVQTGSGVVLLSARMVILYDHLPAGVVEALQQDSKPFGQMLIDLGIAARSVDREIFTSGTDPERLGRRHRIVDQGSGRTICTLTETLSPEAVLQDARRRFLGDASQRAATQG